MMYWPVAKEISFKETSIFALVAMLFRWAKHSDQFLVEGIMRNISVKLF